MLPAGWESAKTKKGQKIFSALVDQYGSDKAKHVFYGGINKGTFTGVHKKKKKRK